MFTSLDINTSCSFYHFYILFPFSELKATFPTQSILVIPQHSGSQCISVQCGPSPRASGSSPAASTSPECPTPLLPQLLRTEKGQASQLALPSTHSSVGIETGPWAGSTYTSHC